MPSFLAKDPTEAMTSLAAVESSYEFTYTEEGFSTSLGMTPSCREMLPAYSRGGFIQIEDTAVDTVSQWT